MPYGMPWETGEWPADPNQPTDGGFGLGLPPGDLAPWETAVEAPPNTSPVPDDLLDVAPAPAPEPPLSLPAVAPGGSARVSRSRSVSYNPSQRTPTAHPQIPGVDDFAANMAPGQAAQEQGIYEEAAAAEAIGDLREQSARAEHNIMLDSMAERHSAVRRKQQIDAEAQNQTAAAWAKVQEVNPGRLWTDASNMQRASGLASAFIGGFLAPYNGGKNAPLESMMAMIDQDIQAQQANQEMQRSKAYATDRAGDAKSKAAAEFIANIDFKRAQRLEAVAKTLEQESAKYQSQITQGKFMEAIGQLRTAAGESLNKSMQWIASTLEAQAAAEDSRKLGWAGLAQRKLEHKDEMAVKAAEAAAKNGKDPLAGREIVNPATRQVIGYQRVGGAEAPVKTQEKLNGVTGFTDRFVKFMGLQRKVGGVTTTWNNLGASADKQELIGLYEDLVGDLVRAKTGAAATTEERNAVKKTLPLERFFGPDSDRALQSFLETTVNQSNYDIGGFVTDAQGNPVSFNFNETADRMKAKYGWGNENAALPDNSLNTAGLKVEASWNRSPQEFISSVREYTTKAHDLNDTPAGREQIRQFMKKLEAVPREQRMLPSGTKSGAVEEIDAIEALDIILKLGELEQAGGAKGRDPGYRKPLPGGKHRGGTR